MSLNSTSFITTNWHIIQKCTYIITQECLCTWVCTCTHSWSNWTLFRVKVSFKFISWSILSLVFISLLNREGINAACFFQKSPVRPQRSIPLSSRGCPWKQAARKRSQNSSSSCRKRTFRVVRHSSHYEAFATYFTFKMLLEKPENSMRERGNKSKWLANSVTLVLLIYYYILFIKILNLLYLFHIFNDFVLFLTFISLFYNSV